MHQKQAKEERVHAVFENISEKYDFMNGVISFQRHKAWRKDVMKKMNVKKGEHALDVCCGTADWTIALGEAVGKDGTVVGLDFSQNMLSVGEMKIQDLALQQVKLVHGNAMKLPFSDHTFDYVTIGFGLRNVPNYEHVISEMARVVKPGGKVVCLETSTPKSPIMYGGYRFYFKYIMPILGKMFAKSYNDYSWLQESAKEFLSQDELKALFEKAGLTNVIVKPYTFGVAAMHMGTKPFKK